MILGILENLKKKGRVENANHIPRGMLEFWLDPDSIYFKKGKLDLNKEMVLFCAGGLRSALAAKSLKDMGFKKVSHIDGGFGAINKVNLKLFKNCIHLKHNQDGLVPKNFVINNKSWCPKNIFLKSFTCQIF